MCVPPPNVYRGDLQADFGFDQLRHLLEGAPEVGVRVLGLALGPVFLRQQARQYIGGLHGQRGCRVEGVVQAVHLGQCALKRGQLRRVPTPAQMELGNRAQHRGWYRAAQRALQHRAEAHRAEGRIVLPACRLDVPRQPAGGDGFFTGGAAFHVVHGVEVRVGRVG